jgi:hypothetical protein
MTLAQLEKRVERLEKIIQGADRAPVPFRNAQWWLDHAGAFADDPGYEEIVRLGRKYRESLRPKARKSRR